MDTGDQQGIRDIEIDRRRENDESRRRQLRGDARWSLAEGPALSEILSTFTGAARPR